MSSFTVSLSRLAVHQDFFWFLSLLAWSLVLVLWRRHPQRRTVWAWLPWAGGMAVVTAITQFGVFNPSFDIFLERLVPGTMADYRPALINPNWLGDVLIGAAEAAMIAAWGWLAAGVWRRPRLRLLPAVLCGGLSLWRAVADQPAGWWLALPALATAALLGGRRLNLPAAARTGLGLTALLPLLSTIGPVAAHLGMLQRSGPPQPVGLAAACAQLLAGGYLLFVLGREARVRLAPDERGAFRRDARPYVLAGAALLVAGVGFGVLTGRDNRREIQQNRLRQTAGHALTFEAELLAPLASPGFRLDRLDPPPAGGAPRLAWSAQLATDAFQPAAHELLNVAQSTPFLHAARLLMIHDGWLVAVASTRPAGPPGTVELLRRATPDDYARWEADQPYVEESPVPEIGNFYHTRSPIPGTPAWLDGVRAEYFLSVERRWRAGPFVITALGLVLLAQMLAHRWGARLREAALRDAALAAEASRIKTAFLAKVSHELRTPLQSILGYSELLHHHLPGRAGRAHLAALRQHGELMLRLVNDLLDFGAIETGAFRLVERPVDLVELTEQTVESLRPRAAAKGLALSFRAGPGLPRRALADAERVRQLLLNLLGNALKFTATGGIEVRFAAAGAAADGAPLAELVVADTGPGIAAADQARIFEPFLRLDPAVPQEGAGLGLALAAALCRSMGGDIGVESDGRTGSVFRARFALVPVSGPAPSSGRAAGRRILVADDNHLLRELFAAHLTSLGAACVLAENGEQALARAKDCDAIVLDLAMPGPDGFEVARRLRAGGCTARIVGVSAHAGPAEQARALAAGMDLLLIKPVELSALAAALNPAFAGAAATGEEELRARLARQFRAEASSQAANLATALSRRDWPAVATNAHYLKSSAAVVRDDRLFTACGAVQAAAEAGEATAVDAAWSECRAALAAWSPDVSHPRG